MLSPPRTYKSTVFLIDSYAQKVLLSITITFLSQVDSSCLRRNCRKFAAPKNAKNDQFFTDLNHVILECVNGRNAFARNLMSPILFYLKVDSSSGPNNKKALNAIVM